MLPRAYGSVSPRSQVGGTSERTQGVAAEAIPTPSRRCRACGGRLAHRASPTACTTSWRRLQVSHRRARTAASRAHPARASARHPLISPLRDCRRSASESGFLLIHRRPSWSATDDRAGALPTHARAARALAMCGPPRASTPPAPRPVRTPVDLCSRGPCDCRTGGPMFTSCAWTRRCLGRLWSPREAAHRESQLCASGRCASRSCASAVAARRRHEPYAHCHRMTARIFVCGRNT